MNLGGPAIVAAYFIKSREREAAIGTRKTAILRISVTCNILMVAVGRTLQRPE